MNFKGTSSSRIRAKKRRYRKEMKFRPFRVIQFLLMFTAVFGATTFGFMTSEYFLVKTGGYNITVFYMILTIIIVVPLLISFFVKLVGENLASNWITNIFNEIVVEENGFLRREYSYSMGAGAFEHLSGKNRVVQYINLNDITELKLCRETGRIEFKADTRIIVYSDFENKNIQSDCFFLKHVNVFYDCYEPSLIDFFVKKGCTYQAGDMKYILNDSILYESENKRSVKC